MTRPYVPQDVLDAAHARAAARAARDWSEADRLRAEIEAAGWRVVDRGTDFALEPAHPPEVEDAVGIRHGRVASVPSRLASQATVTATIIVTVQAARDDLEAVVAAIRTHAPAGTHLVIAADAPTMATDEQVRHLLDAPPATGTNLAVEAVRTSAPLGLGALWDIGLRRAAGRVVILLGPGAVAEGDFVTPLVAAFSDPDVVVVGARGWQSTDLRHFSLVDRGEPAAIEGTVLAFRRDDGARLGPIDAGFRSGAYLDVWWSLTLRDRGAATAPGRAVIVDPLPVRIGAPGTAGVWAAPGPSSPGPSASRDPSARRAFYRLLARFRDRADLAVSGSRAAEDGRESSDLARA